jgi:hypothetical protein
MNFLRGILSIGIVVGCLLSWIEFETSLGIFLQPGLTWVPVIILLYISALTVGYAFYNSYRHSNQNPWIYLTCGLYGIGICIYIFLSATGIVNFSDMLPDIRPTELLKISFGFGLYLTGAFSFLLFLTGFHKYFSKYM